MKQLFRPALSLVLGVIVLCVLHHYPQTRDYLNSLTVYLVFLGTAFLTIYCTVTRRKYRALFAPRQTKTEYVLSGNGDLTSKKYRQADHPGFGQVEQNREGAVYCDEAGAIICTRYQYSVGPSLSNPLILWGECLAAALCGLLGCWLYIQFRDTALLSSLLVRVRQNVSGLQALPWVLRGLLDRLVQDLQLGLEQIRTNLDMSRVREILLQNLERR